MDNVLEVRDLSVSFAVSGREAAAVSNVDFLIPKGKTLGLVGESGSGKSVSSLAIMQLLDNSIATVTGEIKLKFQDVLSLDEEKIRELRGNEMAMIFQEPMTSLNPVYTIGNQVMEAYLTHNKADIGIAEQEAVKMLSNVGIAEAESILPRYPHELSGGMKQRVMIAMSLICKPDLLIADEPTTALDVTVQAQILDLLRSLQAEFSMSILFITHDLGVIAEIADDVCVMYAGKIVEKAAAAELFVNPLHPYTQALLKSVPKLYGSRERLYSISGNVPSIFDHPAGCNFQKRCGRCADKCRYADPELEEVAPDHFVACTLY